MGTPLRAWEGYPPSMKNREKTKAFSDVAPHETMVWKVQNRRGVGGGLRKGGDGGRGVSSGKVPGGGYPTGPGKGGHPPPDRDRPDDRSGVTPREAGVGRVQPKRGEGVSERGRGGVGPGLIEKGGGTPLWI